jgi:hypothetical protein
MFGQLAFVVPPEPPELPEPLDALGAAEADGSGLAALTTATPPIAIKPMASMIVAASFCGPERSPSAGSCCAGPGLPGSRVSMCILSIGVADPRVNVFST